MIVYNVARSWHTEKNEAEAYRRRLGLKPTATLKIEVRDRYDLAALMNALCDPPPAGEPIPFPATEALVERAAVSGTLKVPDYIPSFLLKEHAERERVSRAVSRQKGLTTGKAEEDEQ